MLIIKFIYKINAKLKAVRKKKEITGKHQWKKTRNCMQTSVKRKKLHAIIPEWFSGHVQVAAVTKSAHTMMAWLPASGQKGTHTIMV